MTVIPGKVSGTATIRNDMPTGSAASSRSCSTGTRTTGFSVLDGFELLRIPSLVLFGAPSTRSTSSLAGRATGSMRGSIVYDFVNDVNLGVLTSELDGRTLEGPKSCVEAGLLSLP